MFCARGERPTQLNIGNESPNSRKEPTIGYLGLISMHEVPRVFDMSYSIMYCEKVVERKTFAC